MTQSMLSSWALARAAIYCLLLMLAGACRGLLRLLAAACSRCVLRLAAATCCCSLLPRAGSACCCCCLILLRAGAPRRLQAALGRGGREPVRPAWGRIQTTREAPGRTTQRRLPGGAAEAFLLFEGGGLLARAAWKGSAWCALGALSGPSWGVLGARRWPLLLSWGPRQIGGRCGCRCDDLGDGRG